MTKLDKELAADLAEAYGIDPVIWKHCFTCLKMQKHEIQVISGIVEEICSTCQSQNPSKATQFRLKERPK